MPAPNRLTTKKAVLRLLTKRPQHLQVAVSKRTLAAALGVTPNSVEQAVCRLRADGIAIRAVMGADGPGYTLDD
jgi:biotin operon repressor